MEKLDILKMADIFMISKNFFQPVNWVPLAAINISTGMLTAFKK